MTGVDARRVPKPEEHRPNRSDERGVIAPRQIGSPDRSGEQRIADEQIAAWSSLLGHFETHAAGTMTRRVMGPSFQIPERNRLIRRVELVNGWRLFDLHAEHRAMLDGLLV